MKIGWFTTARGAGSFNLLNTMLQRLDSEDIRAELSFMYINREVKGNQNRARMIKMVEDRGARVEIFPSDSFRPDLKERDTAAWREAYGAGMRERIAKYPMDIGVLAGYMLILDPETCRRHTIINLHPALPDSYKGTWEEIVDQVVDNGDDRYGATVHLCTPDLDRGDTIAFDSFDVKRFRSPGANREDLAKVIRAEGVRREALLLMEAIKAIVDGEIVIHDGHVIDASGKQLGKKADLSKRIDHRLS
ncbi:MAG: formyltransferase family protein [Methanomassiliicoccales archaeon]